MKKPKQIYLFKSKWFERDCFYVCTYQMKYGNYVWMTWINIEYCDKTERILFLKGIEYKSNDKIFNIEEIKNSTKIDIDIWELIKPYFINNGQFILNEP